MPHAYSLCGVGRSRLSFAPCATPCKHGSRALDTMARNAISRRTMYIISCRRRNRVRTIRGIATTTTWYCIRRNCRPHFRPLLGRCATFLVTVKPRWPIRAIQNYREESPIFVSGGGIATWSKMRRFLAPITETWWSFSDFVKRCSGCIYIANQVLICNNISTQLIT